MASAPAGPHRCRTANRPGTVSTQSSGRIVVNRFRKVSCTNRPIPPCRREPCDQRAVHPSS
eukprot:4567235-Pyramimonas_sp.AAC.1